MEWVSAGQLEEWFKTDRLDSSANLPQLIRRLILAHADPAYIREIEFRSGDSSNLPGWDGRLDTDLSHPLFPTGFSGWEMGIGEPSKKANEDYANRKKEYEEKNPPDWKPETTTFVFVTPHRWPQGHAWAAKKREEGFWRDVKVIDADILKPWIDNAPPVGLWLARSIGITTPNGMRDIEEEWEEWACMSDPENPIRPELVVAGREENVKEVHDWLKLRASVLGAQADSMKEASAFLYGCLMAMNPDERDREIGRCLVVDNISEFRECLRYDKALLIVAPSSCAEAAARAAAKNHHVYLLKDSDVDSGSKLLTLARPNPQKVEEALVKMGISPIEAGKIALDSGRSITVLHRFLSRKTAVKNPEWARAELSALLLPAFFVGAWDESKDGDQKLLELLSGGGYKDYSAQLSRYLEVEDSPIRKIGSVWMFKSPLDAWFLLGKYVTRENLDLFKQAISSVLTQVHPKYDLSADQRWAAVIYGKSSPYSEWIREGLVKSLVLLSVYSDRASDADLAKDTASNIVTEILTTADKWEMWASLKDVTPLLAEASPQYFMQAIDSILTSKPEVFVELMRDDGGLFDECKQSGILWGLESAAWSSEYIGRATMTLLKLAQIDPGGKWNNRPLVSLSEIFLIGMPQTYASPKERLEAFDALIAKDPKLVWSFAHDYFHGSTLSESHHFRWRSDGATRPGLSMEEPQDYKEYRSELFVRLNDLACMPVNIVLSVTEFIRLPGPLKERLLSTLEELELKDFAEEDVLAIYEHLRETLHWINTYGKDKDKAYVEKLNKIFQKFTPSNLLTRLGWLLSNPWPRLPEGEPKDYEAKQIVMEKAREEAARQILDKLELEEIFNFAKEVQYMGNLGHAIGSVVKDQEDEKILDALLAQMLEYPNFVRGYIQARVKKSGSDWVQKEIQRLSSDGQHSPVAFAFLYLGLPEGLATWENVKNFSEEVEREYWKRAGGYSTLKDEPNEAASYSTKKLLDVSRAKAALQIAGDSKISISSEVLKRLLLELLNSQSEEKFFVDTMDEFHIGHVFRQIYEREELSLTDIAKLEWPYATLFKEIKRYSTEPLAIHRILAKDPSFFAQLVSFVYKEDEGASKKESSDDKLNIQRSRTAAEVLDTWNFLPGIQEDRSISGEALMEWVENARKNCADIKRVIGGDLQIAHLLTKAPGGKDGIWPNEVVRDLIEYLNNDLIDRHIAIGIQNARGVVSKSIGQGGKQERDLAAKYQDMSDKIKIKWPRTGAILQSLANTYERAAKSEDISSELDEFRYS